jgi:hypothetical protein
MKLSDIIASEFGPAGKHWPALSFSSHKVATDFRSMYRPGTDFVIYAGTGDPEIDGDAGTSATVAIRRLGRGTSADQHEGPRTHGGVGSHHTEAWVALGAVVAPGGRILGREHFPKQFGSHQSRIGNQAGRAPRWRLLKAR